MRQLTWMLFFPILLFTSNSFSNSFPQGLGFEIGIGQNNLFWSKQTTMEMTGTSPVNRTELWLTPDLRLTYEMTLPSRFSTRLFIGFNRFGGTYDDANSEDRYAFNALEMGSFFLAGFKTVRLGAGLKANRHLSVNYKHSGSGNSFSEDRSDWFKKWSYNAGACVTYPFSHLHISLEAWFGLTDLCDLYKNKDGWIHENHYRMMLGYAF